MDTVLSVEMSSGCIRLHNTILHLILVFVGGAQVSATCVQVPDKQRASDLLELLSQALVSYPLWCREPHLVL